MSPDTQLVARDPLQPEAAAAFKVWIRRVVKGAAELRAFDNDEIDTVTDPATGHAIMLPEAQAALHGSGRIVRNAFDALPGGVCVLDLTGTVVMTNKAWRAFSVTRAGAGLGIGEGENLLVACRNADASERVHARAIAAGLRQVLDGSRSQFRREYACRSPEGSIAFTLIITGPADRASPHVIVTRENVRECKQMPASPGPTHARRNRIATLARAGTPNRLLASLPASEYERLLGSLEPVTLAYGDILYEPGQQLQHVYFPNDCVVSLLAVVEGHRALEVGLIGCEGVVGSRLAFGITQTSVRALVQVTGTAMRVRAARFLKVLRQSPALQQKMLQFADTLMTQVRQTATCNRFHVVEERLARWLLMTRERLPTSEFHLTHDFIADMLGVRRVGVTVAASSLQRQKLIRYRRGNIRILNQRGLEAAACTCYQPLRIKDPEAGSA